MATGTWHLGFPSLTGPLPVRLVGTQSMCRLPPYGEGLLHGRFLSLGLIPASRF